MRPTRDISRLLEIMAALRTPVTGCPWDLEQTFESLAPYAIEEAHEVAEAISRNDLIDLKDELGDLLLQVVFHAQIAKERGIFDFGDVVAAINEKLVRRHPHIFGEARHLSPDGVKALWNEIKAAERAAKAQARGEALPPPASALSGVPAGLPPLTRAVKLQEKASKVGFDWNDARLVLEKIREEIAEVEGAVASGNAAHIQSEIGDLFFALANLARHVRVDPDAAIAGANAKFQRRFGFIEKKLALLSRGPAGSSLEEMDTLWNEAKLAGL